MYQKVKHFIYWLFIAKKSGLHETPHDPRDFNTGLFNWFGYTPKHRKHIISTVSVKNQLRFNTCQWNATTTQKEVDEKEKLSVRGITSKGKQLGYISGNGYSNLRSGQKVMQSWGMLEFGTLDESVTDWQKYIIPNPGAYKTKAAKHKTASYWSVTNRDAVLKLLDKGKILTTGIKWYSSFNQGGGFKYPWVINDDVRKKGYAVGGHAFVIKGYDLDKKLYICQNSYGPTWGDHGDFYVDMSYMDANNYSYYTNLDEIHKGLAEFIIKFDGKNVKGKDTPGIFHIQAGRKKPYTSWLDYLAWNGLQRGFTEVDQILLDEVPISDHIMDVKKSNYWTFLKEVKKSKQLDKLIELLHKEK